MKKHLNGICQFPKEYIQTSPNENDSNFMSFIQIMISI